MVTQGDTWPWGWVSKLNPFRRDLTAVADSLKKYEQMKDADFLSKLTHKELKKFFLAQSAEARNNMERLNMISMEIKKRDLV